MRIEGINLKLEQLRKKRGMTQKDIANLVGVQQNTVSQWESGKRNPSTKLLITLSEILDCSIDDLYGRATPAESQESA